MNGGEKFIMVEEAEVSLETDGEDPRYDILIEEDTVDSITVDSITGAENSKEERLKEISLNQK